MSGKSKYRTASDNLLARVSGPWAEEKLEALRRYVTVVLTAMKTSTKWKGCCYLDLLAGGGRCILENGREFDGSPLIALRCVPPFTSAVLVEQHLELIAALRTRTAKDRTPVPTIVEGNCNDPEIRRAVVNAIPRDMLTITFIDNLGWDVPLSTISQLVNKRRMDLVVTFQTSALIRNLSRAMKEPKIEQQWNAFLGVGWRKAIEDFEAKRTAAPDVATALADYYAMRLKTLGYDHAETLRESIKNTNNAELYRMMSFSKHPLGKRLFGAVSRSVAPPSFDFGDDG